MKKGFTLAEVLITLGIIGIVAAMTLPTLVNNYKKKTLHTQFLKAYSDMNNAAKLFEVHEGQTVQEFSKNNTDRNSQYDSTSTLKRYLQYFKGTRNISTVRISGTNYSRYLGYTPKALSGWYDASGHQPCDESIATEEISGRIYTMDNDLTGSLSSVKIGPKICVDINGRKGPNIYGYDWFVFAFTENNLVTPYIGNSWSSYGPKLENPETYCNYSQSDAMTYTCAHFALQDVSPEDPSKKYWTDFLK